MFVQRACLMTVALALAFAWGGNDARGEKPNKKPPAPQPAPQPAPPQRAPPPTVVPCPSAPDMLAIPAGTFRMGSNEYDDEKPVHAVTVAAFCMDPTEVTVAAYKGCTSCSAPNTSGSCNWGVDGRDNHPINCVDWNQATAFCTAVGKRLPTEEEWEYAARGAAGWKYPWGNTPPSNQLCWDGEGNDLGKGNRTSTCPVGSYAAGRSPFGLEDMAGNVWEWTSSPYCSYPGKSCTSSGRVFRGGSWSNADPAGVRASFRFYFAPTLRFSIVGFRCLRAD
ncbi:MAG: SUMF1/EgtB/PvdO family nonheme iron enzyme [Myxococcales bacterium]